jgi:hypothetical protein
MWWCQDAAAAVEPDFDEELESGFDEEPESGFEDEDPDDAESLADDLPESLDEELASEEPPLDVESLDAEPALLSVR